ncbi:MAG: YbjQ family protein [Pseudomonadota bacterium]
MKRPLAMPIATTDHLDGYDVGEAVGLARGSVVRTRHVGADIVAALRALVGGEVPEYTKMMAGAREQAVDRMIEDARAQGGEAVVAMRFASSSLMRGATEIIAYGTAVRLRAPGDQSKYRA